MSLQLGKDMWIEELLNWIPTKSVPEWLNKLTGTHSFIGYLEILPQECYLVRSFQHWTTDYHVK